MCLKVKGSVQAIFAIFIFVLLSSQDGFDTHTHVDEHGRIRKPALYNGIFSAIAFLVGAIASVASGYIGMKIATYANARTALEARKGIAPAFAVGIFLPSLRFYMFCLKPQRHGLYSFVEGITCLGSSECKNERWVL